MFTITITARVLAGWRQPSIVIRSKPLSLQEISQQLTSHTNMLANILYYSLRKLRIYSCVEGWSNIVLQKSSRISVLARRCTPPPGGYSLALDSLRSNDAGEISIKNL